MKKYYSYIKEKAQKYLDERSSLNIESKMKSKFFSGLSSQDLLEQMENIQAFFKTTFEVNKKKYL